MSNENETERNDHHTSGVHAPDGDDGPKITYRISYMIHAHPGERIFRAKLITKTDNMPDALAEWHRDHPGLFVVACTIADHPAMHATVDA